MSRRPKLGLGTLAAVAGLALAACSPDAEQAAQPQAESAETVADTGDWPDIRRRGALRLARRAWVGFDTLASQGLSAEEYRNLAEEFAARHGLEPTWIVAADMDELFALVDTGRADIAAWNITVTAERGRRVAFSLPLTRSREWVIGTDEAGRFGVADHTAYVDTLAAEYPDAERVPVPADAEPLGLLALIEQGDMEATIMDEAVARSVLRSAERAVKLRELPDIKDHAWALRLRNPLLKEALDEYLLERHTVASSVAEVRDWPAIVQSGRLRLLTLNAPTTYYLWRGARLGFEYEMVRAFAEARGLRLDVVVGTGTNELIDLLVAGRGDLIAAGLTPTAEREQRGLRFTRPYLQVRGMFVTSGAPVTDLDSLAGRRVAVNPVTSHAARLDEIGREAAFDIELVPKSTEAILDAVVAGDLDVTLMDSHFAELEKTFEPSLSLGLALEPPDGLSWAVAEANVELHRILDAFIAEQYRGHDFNVLHNKYFRNERRMRHQREERVDGTSLSPYDDIVRRLADAAGFDWRLIVAQMYQESGFDPDIVSFAGAKGLLQVMPIAAREVGADPDRLHEPAVGIDAGIKYLRWAYDRFPDLPVGERHWFALASYNAGAGHVRDGRRLAERLDLDGSVWFGNVEQAMLKLAEPEYASRATHGYVRGTEVVRYVRDIRARYSAYVDHFRVLDESG